MRDFGSIVTKFLVKEGLSDESGQRGRSRGEETLVARSGRQAIFEHRRRNMLICGGNEERPERAKLNEKRG